MMYKHESSYKALPTFNYNQPGTVGDTYVFHWIWNAIRWISNERDRTHPVVPDGESLSFLVLGGCFPHIVTVPPQGEPVGHGVYQQIEQFCSDLGQAKGGCVWSPNTPICRLSSSQSSNLQIV